MYTAIELVTHHQTRLPVVVYSSHKLAKKNVRPLIGWAPKECTYHSTALVDEIGEYYDVDGWNDLVTDPHNPSLQVPRFRLLNDNASIYTLKEYETLRSYRRGQDLTVAEFRPLFGRGLAHFGGISPWGELAIKHWEKAYAMAAEWDALSSTPRSSSV